MPTDQQRLELIEMRSLDREAARIELARAKEAVRRAHVRLAKAVEELLLLGVTEGTE